MSKQLYKTLALVTSTTMAAFVFGVPLAQSQTPTPQDSLVDLETIKEQVKQRIQDVVEIEHIRDISSKPLALPGTLTSIANNTLTIETESGTQLASTSAQTRVQQLPKLSSLDLNELSIDDYVVVMGLTGNSEVLDARHILVHDTVPEVGDVTAFYGVLVSHDVDEDTILLQNPLTNEQKTFSIGRNTVVRYQIASNEEAEGDSNDVFETIRPALVLYKPVDDEDDIPIVIDLLINQMITADSDILVDPAATESAQPPELES